MSRIIAIGGKRHRVNLQMLSSLQAVYGAGCHVTLLSYSGPPRGREQYDVVLDELKPLTEKQLQLRKEFFPCR